MSKNKLMHKYIDVKYPIYHDGLNRWLWQTISTYICSLFL